MRVAAVQFAPVLGAATVNLERVLALAADAVGCGAELVVFPECALQGYVFHAAAEAQAVAEPRGGPVWERLLARADELDAAIVCGLLERTGPGYANTVLAALPGRAPVVYRKAHLPMLGADRWAAAGDVAARWFDFRGFRFGLQICYDLRFPEPSRLLALAGADAILLATNWPQGYEATADHAARTRAWENRCWLVAANRVGAEGDTRFIGRSLVVEPWGHVVAQADAEGEEILLAEIDARAARSKRLPGHDRSTFDFFASRRPSLYRSLDIVHNER